MKTKGPLLLIGLGNPILGDDGIGWRIVKAVEEYIKENGITGFYSQVDCEYLSLGGLSLMERMEGNQEVIVVDSIQTHKNPIGTIYSLPLNKIPNYSSGHTTAAHDTSLATALEVGKKMGMILPQEVWVIAVEAKQVYEFSDQLSPEIEAVIPAALDLLVEILVEGNKQKQVILS